jgi:Chalcone isomerase-like
MPANINAGQRPAFIKKKENSMKSISIFALILCLTAPFLLYAEFKEPKTGVGFSETMNQEGTDLMLAGAGVRSKMMVKVYAGALYLDSAAKSALEPMKHKASKPDQSLYDAISDSNFGKLFLLHFVRDVESDKITEAFRESLEKNIDMKSPDTQKDAEAFLTASKVDMKEGQEMKIYIKGDEVTVTTPSGSAQAIKNARLAGAVARIWLGKNPISEDLKKGMVSRLPQIL